MRSNWNSQASMLQGQRSQKSRESSGLTIDANERIRMSGSLSVLFGLSKALRCGNSEDFMQQYDTLVKQAELSDYVVGNTVLLL